MKLVMCLLLLIALMASTWSTTTVSAQSDCTNILIGMAPCLYYITGNSSTPSQQCCSQLAYVVRSSPKCLCQVLKGGASQFGINVNQTQALALPTACNVQTPPASRCNGDSNIVNTPAGSTNTSEHGNGSKTTPRDGSSSNGSFIKFSIPLLSFLFTASYITISIH